MFKVSNSTQTTIIDTIHGHLSTLLRLRKIISLKQFLKIAGINKGKIGGTRDAEIDIWVKDADLEDGDRYWLEIKDVKNLGEDPIKLYESGNIYSQLFGMFYLLPLDDPSQDFDRDEKFFKLWLEFYKYRKDYETEVLKILIKFYGIYKVIKLIPSQSEIFKDTIKILEDIIFKSGEFSKVYREFFLGKKNFEDLKKALAQIQLLPLNQQKKSDIVPLLKNLENFLKKQNRDDLEDYINFLDEDYHDWKPISEDFVKTTFMIILNKKNNHDKLFDFIRRWFQIEMFKKSWINIGDVSTTHYNGTSRLRLSSSN